MVEVFMVVAFFSEAWDGGMGWRKQWKIVLVFRNERRNDSEDFVRSCDVF
jgi:hypothetical protein